MRPRFVPRGSQLALGASTGELAACLDYTPRGMRKLIATEGVQRLVVEERRALAETLDDYRADFRRCSRSRSAIGARCPRSKTPRIWSGPPRGGR